MGAKEGPQLTEKGYSQQSNFLKIENLSTLIRPQQGGMWAEAISNGGKKGILAAATLSSQHQVVVWICFWQCFCYSSIEMSTSAVYVSKIYTDCIFPNCISSPPYFNPRLWKAPHMGRVPDQIWTWTVDSIGWRPNHHPILHYASPKICTRHLVHLIVMMMVIQFCSAEKYTSSQWS